MCAAGLAGKGSAVLKTLEILPNRLKCIDQRGQNNSGPTVKLILAAHMASGTGLPRDGKEESGQQAAQAFSGPGLAMPIEYFL